MSSIPVRRTTRVVRSTKDNENANARPSRIGTTRTKSMLGGVATATSATTRATASTAASKAKVVSTDAGKDEKEAGIKRKREVLVEVTGLVSNNKPKVSGTVAKGKEAATTENVKETMVAKPKVTVKPPSRRLVGAVASRRLVARAGSETKSAPKAELDEVVPESKPSMTAIVENMEVDVKAQDEEEAIRAHKRRHTDEKPVIHAKFLDDSQVEADVVAKQLQAVEPSPPGEQLWDDLDAEDWDDPFMVSEYVADVCVYLKEIELATLPNPEYMKDQNEITWEHRGILVDWLLQVHARFSLQAESLFLCINVLDRFLGSRPIAISKLQLVGLTCFFIATKYEETYAPSVKEITYLADDQYTTAEILTAERYILRTIEWDLRAPGPLGWLRRASKADDCELHARTISKYLLEIGCVERRLIGIVPSLMAAAAIWLARLALGREKWTPNLEHYTTYAESELIPIATIMLEYIITDPVQHESLYKKYAHKRYFRCSAFMQQWSLERWPENGDVKLKKDLAYIKEEIRRQREYAEMKQDREQEGTKNADEI